MAKENYIKVLCCSESLTDNIMLYNVIFSTTKNIEEIKKNKEDIIEILNDNFPYLIYDIKFKITQQELNKHLKDTDYNGFENIDDLLS